MTTEKFGRYEIKAEIGRGGMATVFEAYDPRFERDVAIKVLPKEFLHDPQFRARFDREAKTVALLEHPAIVPVYDFGEEEGQPYIVMRYMSGGSLSERLAQGALSLDETTQLFKRLAPALDAAHAKGIIHRDLKPGNILFDQYGNACISDFGIARLAQSSATLTGGNILGTPAYMSPEQVQGDKEIDGRSDIYAMGVIAFQMLTGNAPYQATTPARIMMMHILEPIPQIVQIKQNLPPSMQSVIEKAMAKDPDERFSTTTEMAQSLEAVLTGSTPSALPAMTPKVTSQATHIAPTQTFPGVQKPPTGVKVAKPATAALPVKKRGVPWVGILIGIVILGFVAVASAGGIWWMVNNNGTKVAEVIENTPYQPPTPTRLPTETSEAEPAATATTNTIVAVIPSDTPEPIATDTPAPTLTDTPEPTPGKAIIGGADKMAFISNNDIWMIDVNGENLVQISNDGAQKTDMQWMPGGQSLIYITGKCIKTVNVDTLRVDLITCFEAENPPEAFEISPDGKMVAVSLNRALLVVEYNVEKLKDVRFWNNLVPMAACKTFAPYDDEIVTYVRWSEDGKKLAMVIQVPSGGKRVDVIRVINVADCYDIPERIGVQFPESFFGISGYNENPRIPNFHWTGDRNFVLTGYIRNNGYGDMYFFDLELNRAEERVNPIDGSCCYRDPSFSPDGRYIAFAYQANSPENKILLYYIPAGTIGTGEKYQPIPLPDTFFSVRTESPQPILRPAP